MRQAKLLFAFIICLMITLNGCFYNNVEDLYPSPLDTITTFKDDILPFIKRTCANGSSCHASGSNNLVLETYDQIYKNRDRIETRAIVEKTMPPAGKKPSPEELDKLKQWIDRGAPND